MVNPATLKAIVFDFDHTLLDSAGAIERGFYRLAEQYGLSAPTEAALRSLSGIPLRSILHALWPDEDVEELRQAYVDSYDRSALQAIPGALETLRILKEQGYELYVLSSNEQQNIIRCMEQVGIPPGLFTEIVGVESVPFHKPDKRVFDFFLERYTAEELVYVGDSLNDLAAAKRAQVPFVAVLTGGYTYTDFTSNQADLIFHSVKDLAGHFTNGSR